ncbi:MAG: Clp protease ClpP [Dehalococcoidia bacterium]|nr:Clp protease ClpP [Dehalococcoidia bacterium]
MEHPMSPALEAATIAMLESQRAKFDAETAQAHLQNRALAHTVTDTFAGRDHALRYILYGPISPMTVADCISQVDRWSRREPGAAIEIVFNSPGGSVIDGFALFDFLRALSAAGHHITTTCIGQAASMAAILMQAGDTRQMAEHAVFMVHEISSGAEGSVAELADHLKLLERLQGKGLDILTARSKLTRDELASRWKKTDWYMDATEALDLGLIDRIV